MLIVFYAAKFTLSLYHWMKLISTVCMTSFETRDWNPLHNFCKIFKANIV